MIDCITMKSEVLINSAREIWIRIKITGPFRPHDNKTIAEANVLEWILKSGYNRYNGEFAIVDGLPNTIDYVFTDKEIAMAFLLAFS